METRFWSNKNYVEDLFKDCPYRISVKTIGSGNRGVYLYLLNDNVQIEDFIKLYNGQKSKYAYFYLTCSNITKGNPIYVSIRKIGYNYGSKIRIK